MTTPRDESRSWRAFKYVMDALSDRIGETGAITLYLLSVSAILGTILTFFLTTSEGGTFSSHAVNGYGVAIIGIVFIFVFARILPPQ